MNCQDKGPALATNNEDQSCNKKIPTYPIVISMSELDEWEDWKGVPRGMHLNKGVKGEDQPWIPSKVVSSPAEDERKKKELKGVVPSWKNKVVSSPSENDILTEEEQKSAGKRKDKPKVIAKEFFGESFNGNVTMRDKKGGALSRVQKLKKRLSHSFGRLSISKEDADETPNPVQLAYTGYSEEFLDRLEPNGNIHSDKKRDRYDWARMDHERVHRQLSVSSDSKLLDEDIREEAIVILRPRRPPRPKSEVFLGGGDKPRRKTKRFSAFGGDSPFGKTEAYVKLEQLGMGSYATVYKGYSNLTNQVVALKEIRLQEEEGAPFTAIREASLLKELKHSNIVTLHDIIHTRVTLTFVFEYVQTDLSQYMEMHSSPNRGLNPGTAKLFLFQLLRGLAYCHRRRVLHRDVKPQNLLISEIGELKLADFGLARAKSVPSHTYSHEVVTLWYRPPDVLLGSTEYSTSLDMWGVGCIFVEMLTGVPTFPGVHCTHDQLDKIFKVLGTPTEDTWPGVTHLPGYKANRLVFYPTRKLGITFPKLYDIAEAETIASSLLQLNPDQRIGAEEALQHAYFASFPRKLFELPDEISIFSVEGLHSYLDSH